MSWLALIAAAAVRAAPIITGPLPPTVDGAQVRAAIVEYSAGPVRCGDRLVPPIFATDPLPSTTSFRDGRTPPAFKLAFSISPDGRPHAISEARANGALQLFVSTDDLPAALAAWRFDPGAERTDCGVTFTPTVTPVADAAPATLYRFAALPKLTQFGWQEIAERARTAEGGNCFSGPRPAPLLEGHPDYDAVPQRPGTLSWTMVGFDIDAKGKPARLRTLASDGNVALNRAAIAAVARSRWATGSARTGCSQPQFRRQNVALGAPPAPPSDTPVGPSGCSPEAAILATNFTYPEAFRRRAIEGWAIVRYDVAPWGATGNVSVVAAEPTARFGDSAMLGVMRLKLPATAAGASGCTVRVRFKMPDEGNPASVVAP